jgi:hypothetical protein
LALISEGALDGKGGMVEALATRFGMGGRQLRQLFVEYIGVTKVF